MVWLLRLSLVVSLLRSKCLRLFLSISFLASASTIQHLQPIPSRSLSPSPLSPTGFQRCRGSSPRPPHAHRRAAAAVSLSCLSFTSLLQFPTRPSLPLSSCVQQIQLGLQPSPSRPTTTTTDVASEVFLSGLGYKLLSNRIIGEVEGES